MNQTMTVAGHDALRAEWTKLRTVSGTAWVLAAACLLTVAVGAATAPGTRAHRL